MTAQLRKTDTRNKSHEVITIKKKHIRKKSAIVSSEKTDFPETLLIEVGTEELPPAYIESAAKDFLTFVVDLLAENKIPHGEGCYWYTPKRLVAFIKGVHPCAPDREEEFVGPPESVGRVIDEKGVIKFLPPAIGFASKFGLKPEELILKDTPRGRYFAVSITIPGARTTKILSSGIGSVLSKVKFPKMMVWNSSKFRFARPIRNLLVLYGTRAVVCEDVAGISSNRFKKTFGIGPGFSKKIIISSADKYKDTLKNNACVIVDHKERKERLYNAVIQAAKRQNAVVAEEYRTDNNVGEDVINPSGQTLFDEVNSIVEYPVCVVGSFDENYLQLPEEILITCMKKKQKFFALRSLSDGRIMNKFIAVKNGISSNLEEITFNYERVLVARLEDALFFYKNDLNKSIDELVETKLPGVIFHEKIGNMFEKTLRVERLAEKIAKFCGLPTETIEDIKRGAHLCKFDLTTEMVFEYPELAGIAGAIYAAKKGEAQKVVDVIREHYLPVSSGDKLPSSSEACVVSIADKADTIAADFSVGIIPSGSEDPYGLRRAALGILRILAGGRINIPVTKIFEMALDEIYQTNNKNITKQKSEVLNQISDFMVARLEAMALLQTDKDGGKVFSVDEVRAALGGGFDDVPDFFVRVRALHDIKEEKNFGSILISIKRAANIIKQAQESGVEVLRQEVGVDVSLFVDEEEKKLHSKIEEVSRQFEELRSARDYIGALRLVVSLSQPLEDFFNKVMVMCEDEKLKINRLRLLGEIVSLYSPIADFSKLVKSGEEG